MIKYKLLECFQAKEKKTPTHPVDEDGLSKLDHLEGDLEADWDEIVVEDDEGESVEGKAHAVSVCKHKQRTQHCLALNLSS